MSSKFLTGFEKSAMHGSLPGALAVASGFMGGQSSGKSMAKTTAGNLSRRGYKTRNEETAHNLARVTAPVGALLGLGLALKHRGKLTDKMMKHVSAHPDMLPLYHFGVPVVGGTLGGMAAGAGTGALTSLRGSLAGRKKEHKKTAGPIGSVLGAVAKKGLKAAGGPFSAALTGLGALSDYSGINEKMQKARSGVL